MQGILAKMFYKHIGDDSIYHKLERSEKLSRYEYIRILFEKYRTGLHAIKTALKKKEYRYLKTFLL